MLVVMAWWSLEGLLAVAASIVITVIIVMAADRICRQIYIRWYGSDLHGPELSTSLVRHDDTSIPRPTDTDSGTGIGSGSIQERNDSRTFVI